MVEGGTASFMATLGLPAMMVEVQLVPCLQVQRDLYDLPKGPGRFKRYLDVMRGESEDVVLPLSIFNPMGGDAARDSLDAWIELEAEAELGPVLEASAERLARVPGPQVRVAVVLADDAGGGWTQRWPVEHGWRFEPRADLDRAWATALVWTSERPDVTVLRRRAAAAVYRLLHQRRHGAPTRLSEMLVQEGRASVFADPEGVDLPDLGPDALETAAAAVARFRDADDHPTCFAMLWGDAAARELGHPPLGVEAGAALAWARREAQAADLSPTDAL